MLTKYSISFLLVSFLFFSVSNVMAQVTDKAPEPPYIEVTGSAEVEIVPDEIYLSIVLKEYMDGKDKVTLEKLEGQLVQAVETAGISQKQLGIDDLNSQLRRFKRKKLDVFEQREYQLKITDMKKLTSLFNNLQSIELYSVGIAKVSHSEIEKYRREVKIAAAKAAKEKANDLLVAMDAKVGKPLEVKELNNLNIITRRNYTANEARGNMDGDDAYATDLSFKPIILRYEVFAKFAIE